MDLRKLSEPFPAKDIEWRVSRAGEKNGKAWARVLAYVTNRAIMDRLDSVAGIENWRNEYTAAPSGGVLCGISVRIGDEWVTKWDGAENTDIESVKGGLSGSMKRAAVQWGIGRYLYSLTEDFAVISDNGSHYQPGKQGKYPAFKWDPPKLPTWAVPDGDTTTANAATPQEAETQQEARSASVQAPTAREMSERAGKAIKTIGELDDPTVADGYTLDFRTAYQKKDRDECHRIMTEVERKADALRSDSYKDKTPTHEDTERPEEPAATSGTTGDDGQEEIF